MINELQEGVKWIDGVIDALELYPEDDPTNEIDTLRAVRNSITKIINATAYIVPKCPRCGGIKIKVAKDLETKEWYVNCKTKMCLGLEFGETRAEAITAFGKITDEKQKV